jgi:UDP-N-acetylglucosamine:LPS N-acetylglucosamine transferase
MSNTKKAGRRERLLARKRPTVDYQLAVVDDADAVAELAAAKDALATARFRDDEGAGQVVTDAEARVEKARKAVEACYEPVTLTALPPVEFEALVAKPEHAPRDGKDERWNAETFPKACFLACVTGDDLTGDEWAEFVDGSLSQGEREALYLAAVSINARWPSGAVPND